MAINKIELKRSAVPGKVPTTSSLDLGELALNTYDGKVFLKKDNGTQSIVELAVASGSILSASYAQTSSYSDNFLVNGSLTANGGITGSFSGSLYNLQGTPYHIPFFSESQVLADSTMYQVDNGPGQGYSIAINSNGVTTAAPEALYVYQASTSSYNVISGKGNLDNYLQLNIQNVNAGPTASSDIVATANNGSETDNYIDMGINGGNFNGFLGGPNDAYIYSTGNNLHIGNTSANKHLGFFVGGDDVNVDNKFQLNPNNQHSMTGSLYVSGSVNTPANTINSFTASFAMSASQAVSASQAYSSSYALTASFVGNYLLTSSFNGFATSSNATSASLLAATSSLNLATASLYQFSSSMLTTTQSLYAFSASILSYTASINSTIADILIETASLNLPSIYLRSPGLASLLFILTNLIKEPHISAGLQHTN